MRRSVEYRKLRRIVEDLAACAPIGSMNADACSLCDSSPSNAADTILSLTAHDVTCPWRRARSLVAETS